MDQEQLTGWLPLGIEIGNTDALAVLKLYHQVCIAFRIAGDRLRIEIEGDFTAFGEFQDAIGRNFCDSGRRDVLIEGRNLRLDRHARQSFCP